ARSSTWIVMVRSSLLFMPDPSRRILAGSTGRGACRGDAAAHCAFERRGVGAGKVVTAGEESRGDIDRRSHEARRAREGRALLDDGSDDLQRNVDEARE